MEPPLDLGKIPNLTAGLYQLSVQRANHDCDSSVWFDVEAPAAAERTSDLAGDVAVRR
jgi:hypothetical protein